MQKPVLIIGTLVVAVIAVAAVLLAFRGDADFPKSRALIDARGSEIGGAFALVDQTGATLTDAQVIDKPTLIYFGYTFCPDVCPIDVQVMADATDLLAERGIDVKPVFVTIDPARDTVQELAVYAEAMHPKMVALTGSDDQIAVAAKAYGVIYRRQDAGESAAEYLMQHTAFMYLALPGKGAVAVLRNGFPPENVAKDVEAVLALF